MNAYVPLVRDPLKPVPQSGLPGIRDALEAAALVSGMPVKWLSTRAQHDDVVRARWVYYVVARQMTRASLPRIGGLVRRHHTTVLHGLRVAADAGPEFERLRASAVAFLTTKFPKLKEPPMKIVTTYTPWAPACYQWRAYDDNTYPDSPDGGGATELEALEDLLWQAG